jgi:hypothetical protein
MTLCGDMYRNCCTFRLRGGNHGIVPIPGTAIVGFSYLPIIICTQTYLIDASEDVSASAVTASAILRSVMGTCIPLARCSMYAAMGYG